MHGVLGKPGGPTLGSTTCRVERSGMRAGAQHTWEGMFLDTDRGKLVLKRFVRGERNLDTVTKNQVRAGMEAGFLKRISNLR